MIVVNTTPEFVANITPEIAFWNTLRIYAGGLGYLEGSKIRAATRNNLPMVWLSILYKKGYSDQKIGPNGMELYYVARDYEQKDMLHDTGVRVKVQIKDDPNVFLKVWRLKSNTVPVYLLDADIPENKDTSREYTKVLYPGDNNMKLAQMIILGIGGVRALQSLHSINIYHLNEGYCFLTGIELIRQKMAEGMSFQEALATVKEEIVFTTHTPENCGNQSFELKQMIEMGCFPDLNWEQAAFFGGSPYFNITVATLRESKIANAVSKLHCWVCNNELWNWVEGKCPITTVTNGVDITWQHPDFQGDKTPDEVQAAKTKHNRYLINYCRKNTGKNFPEEEVLTMVEARRFAEYKRLVLIFKDLEWIKNWLNSGKIRLVVAGKPHPDDWDMRNLWNWIWQLSKDLPNLVILPGYDIGLSGLLKRGAHVWLNTPRRPREACGTSGISAALNCAVNLSIKDGWVDEGITLDNGFPFGSDCVYSNPEEQDFKDLEALKQLFPNVVDGFSNKPAWYTKALAGKKMVEQNFLSDRMMNDNWEKLYNYKRQ